MIEPWGKVCDATTPFAALPEIADKLAAWSLERCRESIATIPHLTEDQRARLLTTLEPFTRQMALQAVTEGWQSLQPVQ